MNASFEQVRCGDKVAILISNGLGRNGQEWKEALGRAVMKSSRGGWVLNMGGRFGTPGVCDPENFVSCRRKQTRELLSC